MKELSSTSLKIYPRKGSLLSLIACSNFGNMFSCFKIFVYQNFNFLFKERFSFSYFIVCFVSTLLTALKVNIHFLLADTMSVSCFVMKPYYTSKYSKT